MLELREITKRFGACWPTTASASRSTPAPSTPSSARTAPASRRRCGSPTASTRPTRRDPGRRPGAPASRTPARRDRARHRHGAPALHAGRADDGGREHRARRPSRARRLRSIWPGRGGAHPRASRTSSGWRSIPTRRIEDLSVGQQQRVELLKALYRAGAAADPRRADRRADAAGGRRVVRHPARHARAGQDHRHHHAQALRGAGDLRRRDGDARRPGGRPVARRARPAPPSWRG